MKGWLVFVESNTSGTGRDFARVAGGLGLRPVLLTDDPARYKYVAEDGLATRRVKTADPAELLDACRQLSAEGEIAGVTSSSEYFVEAAATLAQHYGLPAPDPSAIRSCRDKQLQRTRLRESGVGVPDFRPATTAEEAVAAAQDLGFPVVVKAVSGSGSVGVKLCGDAAEVGAHAAGLLSQRENERGLPVPGRILVEAVALGPEFSVETFGRTVIGVTRKYLGEPPFFVEVGHDHPAALAPQLQNSIEQTTLDALDALGLGWGPAHTELRVTADGPVIIEVNPRLAGGFIPELVRLASGIDMITETVRLVAGRAPDLERKHDRYASLRFLLPPADGILERVEGDRDVRESRAEVAVRLYVRPGERVVRRGDFRDRLGHVIACGPAASAAREAAEAAHSRIRLHVRPDEEEG